MAKPRKAEKAEVTEVLIDDVPELEGDPENNYAAFEACTHGVLDDNDCIECRTAGCSGGRDCSCKA